MANLIDVPIDGVNDTQPEDWVTIGKVGGHYGIKGWLKVKSFTRPENQIFEYDAWLINCNSSKRDRFEHQAVRQSGYQAGCFSVDVEALERNANGYIFKPQGFENREQSEVLIGCEIGINPEQLKRLKEGEFYWTELMGLAVINLQGEKLGTVDHLLETGANDVLVVHQQVDNQKIERLLPWVPSVVTKVDLQQTLLLVDWQLDY